jgi:hypothetical protein
MSNRKETIILRMMRTFNLNYTGFQMDDEGSKARLWNRLLSDFDDIVLIGATEQIVSTRNSEYNWSPDLATVREQCLSIQSGRLSEPTGAQSWERILQKMAERSDAEEKLELTETEKKALDQTVSLYDLRHGHVANMLSARRQYVQAFEGIVNRQKIEALTPQSVKEVCAQYAPALPAPEDTPKLEGSTGDADTDADTDWDNVTGEQIVADLQEATHSGVRYDDAGNEIWNYDKAAEHYGDKMDELKKMWGEKK